jgi:hypothetical protein
MLTADIYVNNKRIAQVQLVNTSRELPEISDYQCAILQDNKEPQTFEYKGHHRSLGWKILVSDILAYADYLENPERFDELSELT